MRYRAGDGGRVITHEDPVVTTWVLHGVMALMPATDCFFLSYSHLADLPYVTMSWQALLKEVRVGYTKCKKSNHQRRLRTEHRSSPWVLQIAFTNYREDIRWDYAVSRMRTLRGQ